VQSPEKCTVPVDVTMPVCGHSMKVCQVGGWDCSCRVWIFCRSRFTVVPFTSNFTIFSPMYIHELLVTGQWTTCMEHLESWTQPAQPASFLYTCGVTKPLVPLSTLLPQFYLFWTTWPQVSCGRKAGVLSNPLLCEASCAATLSCGHTCVGSCGGCLSDTVSKHPQAFTKGVLSF
jgi:hypothetical protein